MSATMITLAILCGLNLLALVFVLSAGRRSSRAWSDTQAPWARRQEGEDDRPARRAERPARAATVSVEDLVAEVEETERLAARGESRLAADLARWRQRNVGGNDLPAAAEDGRRAAGGRSR